MKNFSSIDVNLEELCLAADKAKDVCDYMALLLRKSKAAKSMDYLV